MAAPDDLIAHGLHLMALPSDATAADVEERRRVLIRKLHPALCGHRRGAEVLEAVMAAARALLARHRVRRALQIHSGALGLRVTLDE